jgi:hypothetical protein
MRVVSHLLALPAAFPLLLALNGPADVRSAESPVLAASGLSSAVLTRTIATFSRARGYCNSTCHNCWFSSYYSYPAGQNAPGNPDDTCTYAYCSSCLQTDDADWVSAAHVLDIAVAAKDDGALATIVEHATNVRYNEARGSVQVYGCDGGTLVANVPVSAQLQASALRTARENGRLVADR